MPRYLNTRGNTTLAIGICGRCSIKMPLDKLQPDPNSPGLLVCDKDVRIGKGVQGQIRGLPRPR